MEALRCAYRNRVARRERRVILAGILHDCRYSDAHDCQAPNQLAADNGHRGQQELLSLLHRFAEDGMAVVEGVEKLRELENIWGFVGDGSHSSQNSLPASPLR